MPKSVVRPMNSSKNKLNSEIIYNFNPHPNAQFASCFKLIRLSKNISN